MGLAEHDGHGEHGRGECGLQLWYSSSLNGSTEAWPVDEGEGRGLG